jgi:hypothetical protein
MPSKRLEESCPQERNIAKKVAKKLYQTGNMGPLCDFIEHRYFKLFDNRDAPPLSPPTLGGNANELTIKTIFLTVLFNDALYIMDSEKALRRGYADLTMIVRGNSRQYKLLDILIEFKYVKLGEAKVTGEQARKMSRTEVAALKQVKTAVTEATSQVKRYRQHLQAKYRQLFRLRSYVVVALGFERIVWLEVSDKKATLKPHKQNSILATPQ